MHCPECGLTIDHRARTCPRCGASLTRRPSVGPDIPVCGAVPPVESRDPAPVDELVVVFRPANASESLVAESILRSAEIEFMTRGESVQELFGIGRFGAGSSLVVGPVEILVRSEDAADARAMLGHVHAAGEDLNGADDPAGEQD